MMESVFWMRRSALVLASVSIVLWSAPPTSAGNLQNESQPTLAVLTDGSMNQLVLDNGEPFHVTDESVENARLILVPDSDVLLALWNQVNADGNRTPFYAISMDGRNVDRVRQTSYDILLRYGQFDPVVSVPHVAPLFSADAGSEIFIVQFVTQPLEEFRAAIRALGGTVYQYLGNHAHIVKMTPDVHAGVTALPYVRWVGPLHPAYRLEEFMLDNADVGAQLFPFQKYNIMVFEAGPGQKTAVARRIAAMGGMVERDNAGKFLIEAKLTPDLLFEVIRWDEVLFVDRWGPFETDMNIARSIGGANFIETVAGYTGEGVRAEIFDIGFNVNHIDFQSRPLILHTAVSSSSHGAATSGINFGDGTGNPTARGMLPDGQGIIADVSVVGFGQARYNHTGELVGPPYFAVYQSSSVGSPRTTQYTTISADTDAMLFDFDIVHCQSQSNSGGTPSRPQAWAKNIISGGGVFHRNTETRDDDCWCFGASTGPAADGRIKPDLAHFYDWVFTTSCCGANSYTSDFNGTSASTPIIAGHVGLFFQMWSDGIFGNPVIPNGTVFDNRSHAATAKAMLLNTAKQYPFSGQNHDMTRTHQGWGLPDLQNMYEMRDKFLIIDETDILTNLQVARHIVTVEPGEPKLQVTLVYADPPGVPFSNRHRINDLTLKVISPSQTVYWGNNGLRDGNFSTPGGGPNIFDTVEQVIIQNPEAGDWIVEIHADEINEDSHVETPELDADYALVVSGVTLNPNNVCPVDLTIIRGILDDGNVGNVCVSDDARLEFHPGLTQNPDEPPVWLEMTGSSPTNSPSKMSFTLEARVNTPAVTQTVSLFNYVLDEFEEVDSRNSTMNDSVVLIELTGDLSRFVHPLLLKVKAELTWKPPPLILVFPWTVGIDQAIWTIVP